MQFVKILFIVGTLHICGDLKFNCLFPIPFDEFSVSFASLPWYVLKEDSREYSDYLTAVFPFVYPHIIFLVAYIVSTCDSSHLMWGFCIGPEEHYFPACPTKPQMKALVRECVIL